MAQAVERRRLALDLSLGDFERISGLTRQGLLPVRNGVRKAYSEKTRRGVARALRWPIDWYDRLLAGEDPDTLADAVERTDQVDYNSRIARMPEHVRRTIDDLIDRFEAQE